VVPGFEGMVGETCYGVYGQPHRIQEVDHAVDACGVADCLVG